MQRMPATGGDTGHESARAPREPAPVEPLAIALLHLASGGLNNAGLALELALLPPGPSPERATLHMGLGGVHQATRAMLMLRELLSPGTVDTSGCTIPLHEVVGIVRAHAAVRNVGIRGPGEAALSPASTTVAGALRCIESLYRVVQGTEPGGQVSLRVEHGAAGAALVHDLDCTTHPS